MIAKAQNYIDSTNKFFLVSYQGCLTHSVIKSLAYSSINEMEKQEESKNNKFKMLFAINEFLQNVQIHTDYNKISNAFVFYKHETGYGLTTVNYIDNSKIEYLRQNLNFINNLNNSEVSDLYKAQLKSRKNKIGLLNVRKRLKEKIDFEIKEVDNQKSTLILNIRITNIN